MNKSCSLLAFEDPRLMTLADRCLGGGQYTVYYFGGLSILQWTRSASSCKWINLLWSLWTGQSNRDHPLMTRENLEWPRTKCVYLSSLLWMMTTYYSLSLFVHRMDILGKPFSRLKQYCQWWSSIDLHVIHTRLTYGDTTQQPTVSHGHTLQTNHTIHQIP